MINVEIIFRFSLSLLASKTLHDWRTTSKTWSITNKCLTVSKNAFGASTGRSKPVDFVSSSKMPLPRLTKSTCMQTHPRWTRRRTSLSLWKATDCRGRVRLRTTCQMWTTKTTMISSSTVVPRLQLRNDVRSATTTWIWRILLPISVCFRHMSLP